ncbi:MAG: hypothetical protein H7249_17005 [Chitinophagaceae bacterium]|nr:hypothetical protein [Oligoflexus sp.]
MLKKTVFTLCSSPLLLSLWLGGCASYSDDIKVMHSDFRAGNYAGALETFEKSDIKTQDRNKLLYYLEKGMIEDRLSERKQSRSLWMKADALADKLFTVSMSKEAASYIYNDSAQSYAGEDYEKVAIHTMLAHSFISDNEMSEARIEAAKINSKLNEINGFYKDNKNKYKDDAYARFLSGLINESNHELDDAIIDYAAALKIYEGEYSSIFKVSVPNELVRSLYRLYKLRDRKDEARLLERSFSSLGLDKVPLDSASVVVVHEVGLINEKKAFDFVIPINGKILRFSFPTIHKQGVAVRQTGIRLNEGLFEPGTLAQNFNAIAFENLEDRRLRFIVKAIARLILKDQVTQKAEKQFGVLGLIAGTIYSAVTETADTRSWTTLPAAVYVTRVFVKPGDYSMEVSNDGSVTEMKKIALKKGDVMLVRDVRVNKAPRPTSNTSH